MIGFDKVLHFSACFVVSALIAVFIPQNQKPINVSVSFTSGLAIGKEVGDFMNYGKKVGYKEFAKMAAGDLTADGLGIAAGVTTGMLIRSNGYARIKNQRKLKRVTSIIF